MLVCFAKWPNVIAERSWICLRNLDYNLHRAPDNNDILSVGNDIQTQAISTNATSLQEAFFKAYQPYLPEFN